MWKGIFPIVCLLSLLILLNGYTYQNPTFELGPLNIFFLGVNLIVLGELNKKITS